MENQKQNEESNKMLQILNWIYEKVLIGLPGMGTPIDLAHDYEKEEGTLEGKVNSLIRWQISKTATTGFITGIGGITTLPFAIPADIASSYYIELRMIAAIAHLGGYDINDDKVKSLIYLCLVGETAKDILAEVGIDVSIRIGQNLVKKIPGKVLTRINHKVGMKLATKGGAKGVVNLVKVIPIAGGIVGAAINAIATNIIGNYARKTFIKTDVGESITVDFIDLSEDYPNIELLKFYSYLNLIKIDGVKKEAEFQLFDNLINNSLLSDSLKLELIQKLNSNELEAVDYSLFLKNPEQSLELIKNLILIAKCDNELQISEKIFIKSIGNQLGFDGNDIESLIIETKQN